MFAGIKNGQIAKKSYIIQTRKKICEAYLKILWDEGFISGYKILSENDKKLKIFLKYKNNGEPIINSIKSISKPSQKIYFTAKQIWKIDSSKVFIIFSTSKGLKTINQCKKLKIGGEPISVVN